MANISQWEKYILCVCIYNNELNAMTTIDLASKLEYILKLKIKRNDWLLADTWKHTCLQATNHCASFWVWEWTRL